MAVYNAVRGIDKTMRFYEIPSKENEDVSMELVELDSVAYGEPYKARILLTVIINALRWLRDKVSRSCSRGHEIKSPLG